MLPGKRPRRCLNWTPVSTTPTQPGGKSQSTSLKYGTASPRRLEPPAGCRRGVAGTQAAIPPLPWQPAMPLHRKMPWPRPSPWPVAPCQPRQESIVMHELPSRPLQTLQRTLGSYRQRRIDHRLSYRRGDGRVAHHRPFFRLCRSWGRCLFIEAPFRLVFPHCSVIGHISQVKLYPEDMRFELKRAVNTSPVLPAVEMSIKVDYLTERRFRQNPQFACPNTVKSLWKQF